MTPTEQVGKVIDANEKRDPNFYTSPNPYLEEFNRIVATGDNSYKNSNLWTRRSELVHKYSYAIPNDEAIKEIASYKKIIEVGAGTGYWAKLISDAGAEDVVAIDLAPVGGPWVNEWKFTESHYPVVQGDGWRWAEEYPEHTLLMVWPPMSRMATDTITAYKGDTVIYVGEDLTGCTADDSFFDLIGQETGTKPWYLEHMIRIPQWWGIYDELWVLKRKMK